MSAHIFDHTDVFWLTESSVRFFSFCKGFPGALNAEEIVGSGYHQGWFGCPDVQEVGVVKSFCDSVVGILFGKIGRAHV